MNQPQSVQATISSAQKQSADLSSKRARDSALNRPPHRHLESSESFVPDGVAIVG